MSAVGTSMIGNPVSVDGSIGQMDEIKEFDSKFSEKLRSAIVGLGSTSRGPYHGPIRSIDSALDEIVGDVDLWTEALNLMVREWLVEKTDERQKLYLMLMERHARQVAQQSMADPRLQQNRPMWTSGNTQMTVKSDDPAWKNWLGNVFGGK